MKNIRMTVSYHRKVSDGEYGSYELLYSVSADLNPKESLKDVEDKSFKFVKNKIMRRLTELWNEEHGEEEEKKEE